MSKVISRNNNKIYHLKSFNSFTPRNFNFKNIDELYKLNFTTRDISQKNNTDNLTQIYNKKNLDFNQLQKSIDIVKKLIPNIAELINFSDKDNSKINLKELIMNQEKEKMKQIIDKRNKLKKSISDNYITYQKLEKKISDCKLSLYVHSKMEQKQLLLTPNKNIKYNSKFKSKKNKINKKAIKLDFQRRFKIWRDRLNKKKEEISNIKNNLSEIQINKKEVLSKIKNLEKEKKELNIIKNNIAEKLYFYYLNNLKEGIDTQNQGLSFLVKEIINLNKRVLLSYFPDYLDIDSIKYILKQAFFQLELEKGNKQIKKLKNYFSDSMINNNIIKKSNKSESSNFKENCVIKEENCKGQKLNLFNKSFIKSARNRYNNLFINKNEIIKYTSKTGTSFLNINNESNLDHIEKEFNIKEHINTNQNKEKFNNFVKFNRTESHFYSGQKDEISINNKTKNNFNKKLLLNQTNNIISPFQGKKIKFSNISKDDFLNTKNNLKNENDINKICDYFLMNKKIQNLKNNLEENKKNEMERIFQKYLKKDNSKRYINEKERILSALIGKDNVQSELRRQKIKEKLFYESKN